MQSRERVLRALSHQEVDRPPVDLGGTPNSTMCAGAYEAFKAFLGVDTPTAELSRVFETVRMDEAVLQRLPVDTRAIYARPSARSRARWLDERSFVDDWGITYRRAEEGRQYDPVGAPLAEASLADLERHAWPDAADPSRYAGLGEEARALHQGTGYAVCACTADTVLFDRAWQLRGMARFLEDLLLAPEFAAALLDRVAEVQILRQECFLREVGPHIDVLVIADDMGVQNGPLIRPELYRRLVKPFHRRYLEAIRRHTGAKILMHACGSIADLVEDYIDLGVDALNPMQVSAAGMAPAELHRRFAGRMAFWGGIDTQWLLPRGTPEDVRRAVRETAGIMHACQGGYVLAAVHNVQDDVPPENVWAMLEESSQGTGIRGQGSGNRGQGTGVREQTPGF
jgi:uroporphyrinogen decarboxylase